MKQLTQLKRFCKENRDRADCLVASPLLEKKAKGIGRIYLLDRIMPIIRLLETEIKMNQFNEPVYYLARDVSEKLKADHSIEKTPQQIVSHLVQGYLKRRKPHPDAPQIETHLRAILAYSSVQMTILASEMEQ